MPNNLDSFGLPSESYSQSTTGSVDSYGLPIEPLYTPAELKALRLQQRALAKNERLNPQYANSLSGAELQQSLSDAIDQQVYTNPDGTKFQRDPGTGAKIPYNDMNRFGYDTRNLYIDDTTEGNYKLGLARTDQDGFRGRYSPEGTVFSDGAVKDYEGTPGARGVTPGDGALMDVELPSGVATGLEYITHTNTGQIRNRASGITTDEVESNRPGFGSGVSEYTTPDAPMWNQDTLVTDEALPDNTYMPKEPTFYPSSKRAQEDKGRISNMVDAGQYGLGRTFAGIGDAIVDAATRVVKEGYKFATDADEEEATKWIVDSSSMFERDATGNFTGLDEYKEAAEYGYDNTRTKEMMDDVAVAYNDGSVVDVAAAILSGTATAGPEFFLESLGEMAVLFTGGVALKGAQVIGKASTLGGSLGKVATTGRNIGKAAKSIQTSTSKISNRLLAANYSNQILEDRQLELGTDEEISNFDRAIALGGGTAMMLLNKAGVDEMVGNTKLVKGLVASIGKPGGKSIGITALAVIAEKAAIVTGKGAYEGLEEISQEIVGKIAAEYGTDAIDDFFSSETGLELTQAFAGGFAGGATPGAVGAAKDLAVQGGANIAFGETSEAVGAKAKEMMSKAADKVTSTVENVVGKKPEDFSERTPAQQQAYKEAKSAAEATEGDSMSTPDDDIQSAPITPEGKSQEAVEAEAEILKESAPVATDVNGKPATATATSLNTKFDTAFAKALNDITKPITTLVRIRETKKKINELYENEDEQPDGALEEERRGKTVQLAHAAIADLETLKEEMKSSGDVDSQFHVKKMEARIERLIPLSTPQTVEELFQALEDTKPGNLMGSDSTTGTGPIKSTPEAIRERVKLVLGSIAATVPQIEEVIAELDTNDPYRKILESKVEAISNYKNIGRDKIIGGGRLPGVFQWMALIEKEGSLNKVAIKGIAEFVTGQRRKIKAFTSAEIKFNEGDGTEVKVEGYGTNVYKGAATKKLLADMVEEQILVEQLNSLVQTAQTVTPIQSTTKPVKDTPAKAPTQPSKSETKETEVVTPVEPKEAPKATEPKKQKLEALDKQYTKDHNELNEQLIAMKENKRGAKPDVKEFLDTAIVKKEKEIKALWEEKEADKEAINNPPDPQETLKPEKKEYTAFETFRDFSLDSTVEKYSGVKGFETILAKLKVTDYKDPTYDTVAREFYDLHKAHIKKRAASTTASEKVKEAFDAERKSAKVMKGEWKLKEPVSKKMYDAAKANTTDNRLSKMRIYAYENGQDSVIQGKDLQGNWYFRTVPKEAIGKDKVTELVTNDDIKGAEEYARTSNKDSGVILPTKEETITQLDSALSALEDIKNSVVPEHIDDTSPSTKLLLEEISDVAVIVELLGIPTDPEPSIPTIAQLVQAQSALLRYLKGIENGTYTSDKVPKGIANALKWAAPTDITPKRKVRAIWGAGKYSNDARKHYFTQVTEELGEVLEEAVKGLNEGKTGKDLDLALYAQKRTLKVIRFAPATVNKDSDNKTNTELAVEANKALADSKVTVEPEVATAPVVEEETKVEKDTMPEEEYTYTDADIDMEVAMDMLEEFEDTGTYQSAPKTTKAKPVDIAALNAEQQSIVQGLDTYLKREISNSARNQVMKFIEDCGKG